MSNPVKRIYWPFDVSPTASQQAETQSEQAFLAAAAAEGFQSFVEDDHCGASGDDRESFLVWRGKHRSELLLIEHGQIVQRTMLVDRALMRAFDQQARVALDWLRSQPAGAANHLDQATARL